MNRYFRDARYYLGRTVETARKGIEAELGPLTRRARRLAGVEPEPEPEPTRRERAEHLVAETRTKLRRVKRSLLA